MTHAERVREVATGRPRPPTTAAGGRRCTWAPGTCVRGVVRGCARPSTTSIWDECSIARWRCRNVTFCLRRPAIELGKQPGASVTDQEPDAFSRRFEGGIPDPDHEPSNRIFGLRARKTVGTAGLITLDMCVSIALRYPGGDPASGRPSGAATWAHRRRVRATEDPARVEVSLDDPRRRHELWIARHRARHPVDV